MKKVKLLTLMLAGTLAVGALTAYGYGSMISSGKTIIQQDVNLVLYDKNQLVNDATAIVSGEVVSSEVQDDFEGFPATDYIIKVDKIFKGNPGAEVEIRTSGGENAKMKYILSEETGTFQPGEKVVLFLTDDKGTRPDKNDFGYYVLGGFQGKFKEENGKLQNEKFTFDVATFAQELNQIEKSNKAKGLKKLTDIPSMDI
jgi:hypothetical protein